MRKRLLIILMVLFCSTLLSGCSLFNMIDNMQDETETDKVLTGALDLMANASTKPMSQSSADAISKLDSATDALNAAEAEWESAVQFAEDHPVQNWFAGILPGGRKSASKLKTKMHEKEALHSKARGEVDTALATDSVYQQALLESGESNTWRADEKLNLWTWFIIGVVILLIIGIVIILLRRRGAPPAQPVVIQQPAPAPAPVPESAPETNEYDMNYEKRYKALSDMCKKVNMDPDDVLAQCNGDIDKAFLEVSLMT